MRYHRTGEFRAPKKGEWFEHKFFNGDPIQSQVDHYDGERLVVHYWILRVEEDDMFEDPKFERPKDHGEQ